MLAVAVLAIQLLDAVGYLRQQGVVAGLQLDLDALGVRRSAAQLEDLLDEVATRVWSITDQGIEDFQGPYSEFLAKHA